MKKRIKYAVILSIMIITALIIYRFYIVTDILYPKAYSQYVDKYSQEYDLDKKMVYAVIKAESGFNEKNRSHTGARGLMQIMPDTGKWAAEVMGFENYNSEKLYDADTNIHIGCWYLRYLMNMYNQNMSTALAAYNAGLGNVSRWLEDEQYSNDGITLYYIPYAETEGYIDRTLKYMEKYDKYYDEL